MPGAEYHHLVPLLATTRAVLCGFYSIHSGAVAILIVVVVEVTGSLLAACRYLVAAVFCQRRVLRFPAGLPAGYPFCSVCGVSFVSSIRVLGLGPFPF